MPDFKPIEVTVGEQSPPAVTEVEFRSPEPEPSKPAAKKAAEKPAPDSRPDAQEG